MRILNDNKTGLTIVSPEVQYNINSMEYDSQDDQELKELYDELDSWKDENIKEFVTFGKDDLGQYLKGLRDDKRSHYFVFDGGKLVATTMLEGAINFPQYMEFHDYISYCEDAGKVQGEKGFISLQDAIKALEMAGFRQNYKVNFLAVKGELQGRGFGKKVVSAINDNLKYFVGNNPINTLVTVIRKDNVASLKAFASNGFARPQTCFERQSNIQRNFDFYYSVK